VPGVETSRERVVKRRAGKDLTKDRWKEMRNETIGRREG